MGWCWNLIGLRLTLHIRLVFWMIGHHQQSRQIVCCCSGVACAVCPVLSVLPSIVKVVVHPKLESLCSKHGWRIGSGNVLIQKGG
jgi:hypothetical protein